MILIFLCFAIPGLMVFGYRSYQHHLAISDAKTRQQLPPRDPWLHYIASGFVSLGLVFTFVGIALSITGIRSAFGEAGGAAPDVSQVISPLGNKFWTSVLGIFFYLAASAVNTLLARRYLDKLQGFAHADQQSEAARREGLQEAQLRREELARQQALATLETLKAIEVTFRIDPNNPGPIQQMLRSMSKQMSEDLGEKLGDILQNTKAFRQVQDQTRELMQSIQATTTQLGNTSASLEHQLPKLILQLNDATQQMHAAMLQAAGTFKDAAKDAAQDIDRSVDGFAKATMDTVQGMSTVINHQVEASVSHAIGTTLSQTLEAQFERAEVQQAAMAESVKATLGLLEASTSALGEHMHAALSSLKQALAGLEGAVYAFSGTMDAGMQQSSVEMNKGIGESMLQLQRTLASVGNQLDQRVGVTLDELKLGMEDFAEAMRVGMEQINQSSRRSQEVQDKAFHVLEDGITRSREALERVGELAHQAEAQVEQCQTAIEHVGEKIEEAVTTKIAENIKTQVEEQLKPALDPIQVIHASQETHHAKLEMIQASVDRTSKEMEASRESLVRTETTVTAMESRLEAVTEQQALTSRELQADREHNEQLRADIQQVSQKVEHLQQEVGPMARMVSELRERVDNVLDLIKRLATRLTLGWKRKPKTTEPEGVES